MINVYTENGESKITLKNGVALSTDLSLETTQKVLGQIGSEDVGDSDVVKRKLQMAGAAWVSSSAPEEGARDDLYDLVNTMGGGNPENLIH